MKEKLLALMNIGKDNPRYQELLTWDYIDLLDLYMSYGE
jgi:hypothetical protein